MKNLVQQFRVREPQTLAKLMEELQDQIPYDRTKDADKLRQTHEERYRRHRQDEET